MSSLVKIPFALSVLWATRVSLTEPRPPARAEERVGPTEIEVKLLPKAGKTTFWLFGLLEVCAILLSHSADKQLGFCDPAAVRITFPFLLAWACCITGALIRRRCYKALGHMFTYEISIQKKHSLVTSGPYAYVRHPSYSSGVLAMVGAMLCHLTPGAWLRECSGLFAHAYRTHLFVLAGVVPVFVFFMFIVPRLDREDRLMKGQFGEDWVRWAVKTPYKLIPGVY